MAICGFRSIPPRFNTRWQFNNQNYNIFHAVQSKSSLANRRGYLHLVSDLDMVRRGARLKTLWCYVNLRVAGGIQDENRDERRI
jgi:hypothetical protein